MCRDSSVLAGMCVARRRGVKPGSPAAIRLLAAALSIVVFVLDVFTPLGLADPVIYGFVVALGLLAESSVFVGASALVTTVLTVLGATLHPDRDDMTAALVNRSLALTVIWTTAGLVWLYLEKARSEREAHANARAYLQVAQVVLVAFDRELRVTMANPKTCQLLGLPAAQILGRSWIDGFVAPAHRHAERERLRAALDGPGRSEKHEVPVLVNGGEERLLAWRSSPVQDSLGRVVGLLSSAEDVTEHRRSQLELARTVRHLRDVEDALDRVAGVAVTDATERITHVNAKWTELSGYTREELIGSDLRLVDPEQPAREGMAEIWDCVRAGRVWHGELRSRTKEGRTCWVDGTVVPQLDDHGRPWKYVAIARDVTSRRVAEQGRLEAQSGLEAVLRSAPVAICAVDLQGSVTRCQEVAGHDGSCRCTFREYRSVPWMFEAMSHALSGTTVATMGEHGGRWYDLRCSPILDDDGVITGATAVAVDVTERRLAQDALSRQASLAQLGQLAAIVAHEVRNPLAGIAGAIGVICDRLPAGSGDRNVMTAILQRIDGLMAMVQDLLVFSRPRKPRQRPIDAHEVFAQAIELLERDPRHGDVKVRVEGATREIHADPDLLRDVILNLLLNATQAACGGDVSIAATQHGGGVRIVVADTGPGIPEGLRSKVFEPFFTTKSRGTGLGLAICSQVVDGHGGTLSLQSAPGQGTRMLVDLPPPASAPAA